MFASPHSPAWNVTNVIPQVLKYTSVVFICNAHYIPMSGTTMWSIPHELPPPYKMIVYVELQVSHAT